MAERKSRELKKYENNPNVEKVTGANLKFTKGFKVRALKLYESGSSPDDIFTEAGIELKDFEVQYARKSIKRWSKTAEQHGLNNLDKERRGSGSTGRPGGRKFKSTDEELAYLRAENEFLKKLHALEKIYQKKRNAK